MTPRKLRVGEWTGVVSSKGAPPQAQICAMFSDTLGLVAPFGPVGDRESFELDMNARLPLL